MNCGSFKHIQTRTTLGLWHFHTPRSHRERISQTQKGVELRHVHRNTSAAFHTDRLWTRITSNPAEYCVPTLRLCRSIQDLPPPKKNKLDFQVENQPRAAYISRTALVCVEECVHSVMFLKKQLQAWKCKLLMSKVEKFYLQGGGDPRQCLSYP